MSTRACIAFGIGDGDDWRGRYHHFDGYPSGLGQSLYALAQEWDPATMKRVLLNEHTGWSTINDADWSLPPGYGDGDQPKCYCHGERDEDGWLVEPSSIVKSDMEWLYVIRGRSMDVHAINYKVGVGPILATVNFDGPEPDWDAIG